MLISRWDFRDSAACPFGAEEITMNHIINHCTKHQLPNGLKGIQSLNKQTVFWLTHFLSVYINKRQCHTQEEAVKLNTAVYEIFVESIVSSKGGLYRITFVPKYCYELLFPYRYRRYFLKYAPVPKLIL